MYYKNMFYDEVLGSNGVILFLHGWGQNYKSFFYLKDYFSNTHLIFIDLPGFGLSTLLNPITLTDYVCLIESFIKDKNLNNPTIVGHSFGGRIALKMLERHNYKAVLVGTPGFDKRSLKTKLKLILNKFFKIKLPSKDYKNASYIQREIMKSALNETKYLDYKLIKGDVLIVHSKKDRVVKYSVAKKMKKHLCNSALINLGYSHFPHLDEPYKFYKVLDSYASN